MQFFGQFLRAPNIDKHALCLVSPLHIRRVRCMVLGVFVISDDVCLRRLIKVAIDYGMEQNRVRAGGVEVFVHRIFSLILLILKEI